MRPVGPHTLHNGTLRIVILCVLDRERYSCGLREGLVDTSVLHCRAFCVVVSNLTCCVANKGDSKNQAIIIGPNLRVRCALLTEVSQSANLFCDLETLIVIDERRLLALLSVLIVAVGLFSEVALECHKHELHAGAILRNFAHPFGLDVFQGVGRVDLSH